MSDERSLQRHGMGCGFSYGRPDPFLDRSGGQDYREWLQDQAQEAQNRAERKHEAQ